MTSVLGVIGARLNSSRLPRKHLLDLAGKPLIARLFERLERIPEIDRLVLATTDDAYNRPLVEWGHVHGKDVFAYRGDVNDLVGRVDALVRSEQPQFVVYFCGDSPLIEPETVSHLLHALRAHPEADVVELEPPHGRKYIHEGFSVFRRAVWDRLVAEARVPEEREHVGASLRHFANRLTRASIADEPEFAAVEHRISVDTPSDHAFMSEIYRRWYAERAPTSIVSLKWVIGLLQRDSALAQINAHVRQKRVGDRSLAALIVCHAGAGIGLGHLMRSLVVARALQDKASAGVRLLIQGDSVQRADLELLPHRYVARQDDLAAAILDETAAALTDVVLFDLHPRLLPPSLATLLGRLQERGIRLVGIDSLADYCNDLDLALIPSFHADPARLARCHKPVHYGWDCYLLKRTRQAHPWVAGQRVVVLTGGSDATGLGQSLPTLLDQALPHSTEVHWVRGPYARPPRVPASPRLQWVLHEAPEGLDDLIAASHYALTVYGVSFFELLQHGIPTVVFSPYDHKDDAELQALEREAVAVVAAGEQQAVEALQRLMADATTAGALAQRAASRLSADGAWKLAERIQALCA